MASLSTFLIKTELNETWHTFKDILSIPEL